MKNNKLYIFLFLLGVGFLFCDSALASNVVDTAMNKYQTAAANFGEQLKSTAMNLLFTLFGIQLSLNMYKLLIKGEIGFESVLGSLVNSFLSVGFFLLLIKSSSTYLPAIIDSFTALGVKGSGLSNLTPSLVIDQGIDVQNVMVNSFNKATGNDGGLMDSVKLFFPSLILAILCIIIFLSFVVLAAQMALTLIQSYFWLAITPLLMGFGGLSYTKDIAITSLKGGLTIGMKLMCVYLVAGVAVQLAPLMGDGMASITVSDWSPIFWNLAISAILAYLSFQLPKFASDLLNGTASLSAGDAASNMAMGAAAIAGVAAGGAALAKGAAGAATGGAAGASGIAQALSAGMQSAGDLGKTGVSAGAHAAGEVAKQGLGMGVSAIGSAMTKGGESFSQKVADSTGGKIASNIQAGRGGSMSGSPGSSASPSSGSGSDSASKSAPKSDGPMDFKKMLADAEARPAPGQQGSDAGGSSSTESAASQGGASDVGSTNSASSGSSESSNSSSGSQPLDSSTFRGGDASNASIGGGNDSGTNGGEKPYKPPLKDRIRDAGNHVPNDAATVGLNANLSHGGD